MPLTDQHTNIVAFVCKQDEHGELHAVGTTFCVSTRASRGETGWRYFVTAKHVVLGTSEKTWVRVRRFGGGAPKDIPVKKWYPHPTADIAVAPLDEDTRGLELSWQPVDFFSVNAHVLGAGAEPWRGDTIYFAGLLPNVDSMTGAGIPMMRLGTIGALYQMDIPAQDEEGRTYTEPCAHLIDAHSVHGFSGSPCFVDKPTVVHKEDGLAISGYAYLLGVIVAHFRFNYAGIAVVVPCEAIIELLDKDEDMVRWREEQQVASESRRDERRKEGAAVRDSASGLEFERFDDLARKLVQVPKKELDEKRAEEDQ